MPLMFTFTAYANILNVVGTIILPVSGYYAILTLVDITYHAIIYYLEILATTFRAFLVSFPINPLLPLFPRLVNLVNNSPFRIVARVPVYLSDLLNTFHKAPALIPTTSGGSVSYIAATLPK